MRLLEGLVDTVQDLRALHNSEMTTGGHTDYPIPSVKNFDVWLRAHKSQPLSKGLTVFLDFFL